VAAVVLGALAGGCQRDGGAGASPANDVAAVPSAACQGAAPAHAPYGISIIDSHVHIVPTMPALAQALEVFDRSG